MATSPQFPATPIVGQAVLSGSTTSATLYTCSNENGAYVEKVIVTSAGESVALSISVAVSGTTTTIYTLSTVPTYFGIDLDIAIPNGASVGVSVSSAPAGSVHATLFGGLY